MVVEAVVGVSVHVVSVVVVVAVLPGKVSVLTKTDISSPPTVKVLLPITVAVGSVTTVVSQHVLVESEPTLEGSCGRASTAKGSSAASQKECMA